jgi:carbon-monoxide dehydrogenase large subunit
VPERPVSSPDEGTAGAPGTAEPRKVGARVLRREDPRLLTGRGSYVSDVELPDLVHVAFVRSTRGHATIEAVDAGEARRTPGVVAVLTAEDLEGVARPMRATSGTPGYQDCDTPILATGKVRMAGEPIAAVVAESRYQAEDGAAAVSVAYRDLPLALSIEAALADGAPRIHDEVEGNLFNFFEHETGGVEEAIDGAEHAIGLEIRQQRYAAVALEGRVAIASFDRGRGTLTAWLSTQVPHIARTALSRHLDLPEARVRVIAPDMGGGFGPKCVTYQEDIVVAAASRILGRPVKWVSDRVEDLQTTVHGREQLCRIRAGASADGRVGAVSADIYAANGAYAPWPYTAALDSGQASDNVTGPYDIPLYKRRVHAVVTNQTPMGPYRGVGRVLACFAIESVMDELARRLDMDPLEVRRRNLVTSHPHETATGLRFESGDYPRMLDMLEDAMDWKRIRAEDAAARERGTFRGSGVAAFVEHSAYGAQAIGARELTMTPGYDSSSVRMEHDGTVRVAVGLHNHGQGHETTIAQIAAEELGIEPGAVEVVWGDTAVVPYGNGTWASRSTVTCGGATILAARDLRERIKQVAGHMLEIGPDDLQVADGRVAARGAPSRSVGVAEVARRAIHEPHLLPEGAEPGLHVTRQFMPPDPGTFSSAAHAARVEVDIETGGVRILRYVVVEDCGTVVNPMIVEGQVQGGVAQGAGGALSERLAYDEGGTLVTTSLMDYLMPLATDVPAIDVLHLESPSPDVPGGFKGMGEGGAIAAPVAIVGAINDALSPFGIVATHTPADPDWIVRAVREAGSRAD